jgi:hypothetical protein
MDVAVVGVNELSVFTVISGSIVDAVAGNHLGHGRQTYTARECTSTPKAFRVNA